MFLFINKKIKICPLNLICHLFKLRNCATCIKEVLNVLEKKCFQIHNEYKTLMI